MALDASGLGDTMGSLLPAQLDPTQEESMTETLVSLVAEWAGCLR